MILCYTALPKINVSDLNLDEASLTIRKTFSVDIASNELSAQVTAGTNETFLPFDEERYLLTEMMEQQRFSLEIKFDISPNGKTLQIRDLGLIYWRNFESQLLKRQTKSKKKSKIELVLLLLINLN